MKNRKIGLLLFIVQLILCFSLAVSASEYDVSYTVEGLPSIVDAGETFTVSVNLSENDGIRYAVAEISYDPTKISLDKISTENSAYADVHSKVNADSVRIWIGDLYEAKFGNGEVYTGTGVVAELTFLVAEGYEGEIELTVDVNKNNVVDSEGNSPVSSVSGCTVSTMAIDWATHIHTNDTFEAKAPTCTEIGWDEYTVCSKCQTSTYVELPAAGHTEESIPAVDPTPTAPGSTEGTKCSVCGEILVAPEEIPATAATDVKFAGASLSLQDSLAVNFKVNPAQFDGTGYSDPYVVFEFNGKEYKVTEYRVDTNGNYAFTFSDIAPRMIADTIKATIYATYEGETVACQSREYSVKAYCDNKLAAASTGDELRTLLVDLLKYGAAAQLYGNYKVDTLVNAGLTDEQKAWGTTETSVLNTVANKAYETIENPTVSWVAGGLRFEDAVTLRFKIATESIEGLTVKVTTDANQTGWIIDASAFVAVDGGYNMYFDGLSARQMRETVYATVYKDGVAVSDTMTYSIESYAYSKQSSENELLTNILDAMMKYGDSAAAYISSK